MWLDFVVLVGVLLYALELVAFLLLDAVEAFQVLVGLGVLDAA
jgi:hypothetical protein